MKFFVCFLFALAFAVAQGAPSSSQEDFGQAMKVFLNKMKPAMECPMGTTPILAPFTMESLQLKKVYPGLE